MIPQHEIDRIRRETDLPALVRSYGIELVPVGRELRGLCPFHADVSPSFYVHPRRHLFHCHGCGAGGDQIRFVMLKENVEFVPACAILSNGRGHLVRKEVSAMLEEESPVDMRDPEVQRMLRLVMEHYATTLRSSSPAQKYMSDRRLVGPDLMECFLIGYVDGTLLSILPSLKTEEGKKIYQLLQRIRLVTKDGREKFHGFLILAVMDENGVITNLYGRNISKSSKRSRHLNLTGHTGILNPRCLVSDTVVVVESPLDLLSFFVAGVRNVTCVYGTDGYTKKLPALFLESGVRMVQIAFDADGPGETAAGDFARMLGEAGIESERVRFPDGMDPNDVLVKLGPEALRESVAQMHNTDEMSIENRAPEQPHNEPQSEVQAMQEVQTGAQNTHAIRIEKKTLYCARGDRSYRIDGFFRNLADGILVVALSVARMNREHADRIDLMLSKDREKFIAKAAKKLEIREEALEGDLDFLRPELRRMQDTLIAEHEKPKNEKPAYRMSEPEKLEALEFLHSRRLVDLIIQHFRESGYVGEKLNLLAGYIAATSRLLDRPLHVLFQSSSAAGKTTLMKAVVSMMPPEAVFGYSAVSPKALQYMQERDMRHSIFLLEEDRRLDEHAREMIKLLKTEGRVSSMITVKDQVTGMMKAMDFLVEGPMAFLMTTTALSTDEEQINRDLVCSADESREQTARILAMQRIMRTLEGRTILDRRMEIQRLHRNAQRLLRPIAVLNRYATHMTFPEHAQRLRRDHEKYQGLIEAVTLLFQYQREIRTRTRSDGTVEEYIETTLEDIEIANRIAEAVLGQSLDDCPPHTRNFLERSFEFVDEMAKKNTMDRSAVRVSARQLAENAGISMQMVWRHLEKLRQLEWVVADEKTNHPLRSYRILYVPNGESRFLPGILDVRELSLRAGMTPPFGMETPP